MSSYEKMKAVAEAIGPSTLMCSGILPDGDDCDEQATHKCWIGKEQDEWVGVCSDCATRFKKEQRVEPL